MWVHHILCHMSMFQCTFQSVSCSVFAKRCKPLGLHEYISSCRLHRKLLIPLHVTGSYCWMWIHIKSVILYFFYAIVVKAKGNAFCHSLEKTDGKVMCPVKDSICIGCKFSNNIIMHSPDAINWFVSKPLLVWAGQNLLSFAVVVLSSSSKK